MSYKVQDLTYNRFSLIVLFFTIILIHSSCPSLAHCWKEIEEALLPLAEFVRVRLGKRLVTSGVRQVLRSGSCRVDAHVLQDLAKKSQMMSHKDKATNRARVEEGQEEAAGSQQ